MVSCTSAAAAVSLPCGFWVGGRCYREARLRPLTGHDEVFLWETEGTLSLARRTSILLARCLTHLGTVQTATPEETAGLSVGDREALVLHLRRLTFGNRMACLLNCPSPGCGKQLDLDLQVTDLLLPPCPRPKQLYEKTFKLNGSRIRARFRLPVGADQEAVARLATTDAVRAGEEIFRRCVVRLRRRGEKKLLSLQEYARALTAQVGRAMAELDPQAELILNLTCPECSSAFSAPLDAAGFFFRELGNGLNRLYREVHLLAYHYHWSESEILSLTSRKRRLYLDLLSEALAPE